MIRYSDSSKHLGVNWEVERRLDLIVKAILANTSFTSIKRVLTFYGLGSWYYEIVSYMDRYFNLDLRQKEISLKSFLREVIGPKGDAMNDKLFWASWLQPTADHRPLSYPPNQAIIGWWCTGKELSGASTICALIRCEDEVDVKAIVRKDWPEATTWRFIEERQEIKLTDRFPLAPWMSERINTYNQALPV